MEDNLDSNRLNIDITDYWLIIRKRFLHILLIFILVVIGVAIYTLKQVPEFQAECKIKISARQPMATIEGAQINWYGSRGNEIQSEIKLISNKDDILEAVLDVLNKGTESKFITSSSAKEFFLKEKDDLQIIKDSLHLLDSKEKKVVKKLSPASIRGMVKIEQLPQSNIVSIRTKGPYKNLIVAVANVLAIVYRIDYWKNKTREARETKEFIGRQLEDIKRQLSVNKVEVKESSEDSVFLGSVDVYRSELSHLRIELEKLREKYQEKHPEVIRQKKLVEKLELELVKFPGTALRHTESVAEQEQKLSLQKTLAEYYLKSDIDYKAKREKAKDEICIIAKSESASQLSPNMSMNIIVGMLFGVILGCISAFVWEGLDTSIGKIEDVERVTKLPVIAHIPLIGQKISPSSNFFRPIKMLGQQLVKIFFSILPFEKQERAVDLDTKILFNFDPLSMTAEAYRTLRTNIQFAIGAGKVTGNIIAITSTSPREGKTLTSTNLAIALAQLGKTTLLLEADMRRPQIAPLFKIDEKPGLSDILIGTAKLGESIRTFTDILMGDAEWDKLMESQGIDHLHLLPCGTIPPNPSELLLSLEFRELIESLRQQYDFVIIDTPPTVPVSDSSIIGTVVDGTVLIYQSDTTSRHLLLRAIQTLQKNQAKLLGIVINQLSFDVVIRSSRSGYGYGGYGYGYGYSRNKSAK